ncbi:DNA repair rad8 [Fusarium beomiforme]|uniref:DNA repair rad8 n=1 Tax=Fusarium beomiforme TaxID=44412 RepID=A0A9P5AE79_9HYPO|nr:DNA repair rad8 [Fusarium beomiforme]
MQALRSCINLCRASWAKIQFSIQNNDSDHGILRVYLLPDDILRMTVDRSNPSLLRARSTILGELNYSQEAWAGNPNAIWLDKPLMHESVVQNDNLTEDMSLLQLFNKIPSPNPRISRIEEKYSRSAMCDLLDGRISGLKSELYPYQRRSSAMMLQKELQPERVLDPRLLHVKDQEEGSWYIDNVAGTVLKEPRHYDGVSGGILAEEMGSGKTIICLALILATKGLPTQPPEYFCTNDAPIRKRLAPLAEMAASCATRNAVPWKPYFDVYRKESGEEYEKCIETLERNPGYYFIQLPEQRRSTRLCAEVESKKKQLYLSNGSVVVVPPNLLAQWKQEITKHTDGLQFLVVTRDQPLPEPEALLKFDLILFSQTRLETLLRQEGGLEQSPLSKIHFKRCIVDEGHKLGNSRISSKSNMLLVLDALHFSARWIVTGTPSQGLYGVDMQPKRGVSVKQAAEDDPLATCNASRTSVLEMERKDLERIGIIAALYLKARPWANTTLDAGDTMADWATYLLLPKHKKNSGGRWDCLRSTLNSLIIRHQLAEVSSLFPPVNEKLVVLEGSYQDQMSLNIFSMMIIFNSVQSQRTDMDYFFHSKQRKALLQIVYNLKQASFFGGSFYSKDDIEKAVKTAEDFLEEKKVPISDQDRELLEQAIEFGHIVIRNTVKALSNEFHEMPLCVQGLPHGVSSSWSLDGEGGNRICSSSTMLVTLQKLIYKAASKPEELNSLLNGRLIEAGMDSRSRMLASDEIRNSSQILAGNTTLGDDKHRITSTHGIGNVKAEVEATADGALGPLEAVKITSTASAKLSYLIDSVLRYQEDEKILIFYENDNVAWYLAGVLEVLQVQHLIYAKGLTVVRRSQYVNTFNHNDDFRVLLMDISQAAFGLDMRVASRIYFINPVLNPQVEAQAIGRARRISQQKPVFVETLILKNSIEEVILERKEHMTQAEHHRVQSILDVGPIYDWIKNTRITPLPGGDFNKEDQMAPLGAPQYVFRRGFGRTIHPDEGLVLDESPKSDGNVLRPPEMTNGKKRITQFEGVTGGRDQGQHGDSSSTIRDLAARPAKRVRFG